MVAFCSLVKINTLTVRNMGLSRRPGNVLNSSRGAFGGFVVNGNS